MSVKYSKNKALKAQRSASIKSAKIEAGVKLTVVEVISNESADANLNRDEILCTRPDGGRLRIPVREFMNMTAVGGPLYKDSEEDGDIIFPTSITVASSVDRTSTRGGSEQPVYPIQAYNAGAQQIADRAFDFDALLASGLIEGNTMDPVQNYTVELKF